MVRWVDMVAPITLVCDAILYIVLDFTRDMLLIALHPPTSHQHNWLVLSFATLANILLHCHEFRTI